MIRVGFALTVSAGSWHGGVSYFRNLFEALRDLPAPRIQAVVIAKRDVPASLLGSVGATEVLRSRWVEVGSPWWAVRRACQLRLERDFLFEQFLAVNVVGDRKVKPWAGSYEAIVTSDEELARKVWLCKSFGHLGDEYFRHRRDS